MNNGLKNDKSDITNFAPPLFEPTTETKPSHETIENQNISEYQFIQQQIKLQDERLKNQFLNNPLINCYLNHKELLNPNMDKFKEGKSFINLKVIRECFISEIPLYSCDNDNEYYELNNRCLEEIQNNQRKEYFKKYIKQISNYADTSYKFLSEIFNATVFDMIEPAKQLTSNNDIISFKDGIYNIQTSEEITEITQNTIPRTNLNSVNFKYKPTSEEIQKTEEILKYIFVKPINFIRMLKNVFYHYKENKGFCFIYGASDSGKTTIIVDKILKQLCKAKKQKINSINNDFDQINLKTNGLINVIDEIQDKKPNSSFLNEYSGSKTVKVTAKYEKTFEEIKTQYLIFVGENLPNLEHDTTGTYKRVLLVETHSIIYNMKKELLEFLDTDNFINTLFYIIKDLHTKEPEIYKENHTASTYNSHKKDLISVLKECIYSEPNSIDELGISVKLYKNCSLDKKEQLTLFNNRQDGYRLTLNGLKELIRILYNKGYLNNNKYLEYSSNMLIKNIVPHVVIDYDAKNKVQIWDKGKNLQFRMNLTPTKKALDLLKDNGVDIEQFHLINT